MSGGGVGSVALAVLLSGSALAQPMITHTAPSCVSTKTYTKITAAIPGNPTSARVYFHALEASCGDYYVEMQRDPASPSIYTAILPVIAFDGGALVYDIRATIPGGKQISTPPVSVPVRAECATPPLSPDDLQRANSIALGLTNDSQPPAPCKFACNGIQSFITTAGDLKPNEACRLLLAKLNKPWIQTPAGIATAAGAVLAAGVIYEHEHERHPPSPARP